MVLVFPAGSPAAPKLSVREYAHRLVVHRWSEPEWRALLLVVGPESGFNPCRHYPSMTNCFYSGANSCGIPQANPCPHEWRGRLWASRFEQARWLVRYVAGRYGSPSGALSFRRAHGYY